jgi:methionyl-tRNA formyltransferase
MLSDIGFIAANTSRSRAYLTALERNNLLPCWCLLLDDDSDKPKMGQAPKYIKGKNSIAVEDAWSESNFDPTVPLEAWLKRVGIKYDKSNTHDIHAERVIDLIKKAKPSILIYSGYGGVLLRKSLIDCGKKFLHVHGGYLPNFKGSTTNYYSLLVDRSVGASSIFLTSDIDSGPILHRSKFSAPPNCLELDHIYDSAARAKVLVETLRDYQKNTKFCSLELDSEGKLYYIIHPVLKHIAVMRHVF